MCRRRPLLRRDPLPAAECGTPFFLSPSRRHGPRPPCKADGSYGDWRIESVHVQPSTRTRAGLCLSWCGTRHAKIGTACTMRSTGTQPHKVCLYEHHSYIIVLVTIFRVSKNIIQVSGSRVSTWAFLPERTRPFAACSEWQQRRGPAMFACSVWDRMFSVVLS